MTRLTVERVKAAYAKTGLQPARGMYDDGKCACGWSAVSVAEFEVKDADPVYLGVSDDYADDFILGFDGKAYLVFKSVGYLDGRSAAKAMGLS